MNSEAIVSTSRANPQETGKYCSPECPQLTGVGHMHIKPPSLLANLPLGSAAEPPLNVADAQLLIAGWTDLSDSRRRDLVSNLATVARMAGLPPREVLLTPASLRERVLDRSAAGHGISHSTMRTVLSGLRYVMRRSGVIDHAGGQLIPAWEAELDRLNTYQRAGLIGLARFCSANGIPPEAVCRETFAAFETYLRTRTVTTLPRKAVGAARTSWDRVSTRVPGWTGRAVGRLGNKNAYVLGLSAFPESFQAAIASFGQQLGAGALDDFGSTEPFDDDPDFLIPTGRLRASTVALRQSHARWAASALVASGVPIAEVTSLASLVTPLSRAKAALRYLYARAGGNPSAAGHHVGEVLAMIARHHVRLDPKAVAQIQRWRKPVTLSYRGMTEKNERQIREIMQPARHEELMQLPKAFMEAARLLRATSPDQARSLALRAVLVGILTKLPVRLANLVGLRLDRHLQRPDPKRSRITHLLVPAEETKNRRPISLPVSRDTAELIEEWITDYRAPSVPGCAYVFPIQGIGDRPMSHQGLRDAVKDALRTYVGVVLTPHQFRHLAARLFLEAFPGHYEEVRQLLGHESIVSTTRHYSGIESEASARRYDEDVLGQRRPGRAGRGGPVPGRPKTPRKRRG
ncbi:tyrosine-type recombinase/integrase [Falsiroseomonas sp. E2-1-a20]|uniref:tyrosine-type recombinase/integrase n=1 Tax=Falsiroseomonas sp. E2-1-a20 TaxID=3239300 RepID=UPI003F36A871